MAAVDGKVRACLPPLLLRASVSATCSCLFSTCTSMVDCHAEKLGPDRMSVSKTEVFLFSEAGRTCATRLDRPMFRHHANNLADSHEFNPGYVCYICFIKA